MRYVREARTAADYGIQVLRRDLPNRVRYGRHAPRWAQRIWVDPEVIDRVVFGHREESSAAVIGGCWPDRGSALAELPKLQAALSHWTDDTTWEATGILDHQVEIISRRGTVDGCRSRDDLVRRYARIDDVFSSVRSEGRLRTRRQLLGRRAFRELGGIRVHIGPGDEPIFGGAGQHRLAMALVLGLRRIPAQLGVLHPASLETWKAVYGDRARAMAPEA